MCYHHHHQLQLQRHELLLSLSSTAPEQQIHHHHHPSPSLTLALATSIHYASGTYVHTYIHTFSSTFSFPFIFSLIIFHFRSFTRHYGIKIADKSKTSTNGFRVFSSYAPYPFTPPNIQWISTVSALLVLLSLDGSFMILNSGLGFPAVKEFCICALQTIRYPVKIG